MWQLLTGASSGWGQKATGFTPAMDSVFGRGRLCFEAPLKAELCPALYGKQKCLGNVRV